MADPDARVKVNKNMWMALIVSMNGLCLPKICINEINCINLYSQKGLGDTLTATGRK